MDKVERIDKMKFRFNKLNSSQQAEFSRLGNKLLNINYLSRDREKDRKDYYRVIEFLDIYVDYFSLLDFEMINDQFNGVVGIKSSHSASRLQLSKNETLVLLIFRQLYFQKQKEVSLIEKITTHVSEIHENLNATGVLDKQILKTEFFNILKLFRRYGICDIIGERDSDETIIILYPTILHILSMENVTTLNEVLESYKGGSELEAFDED